jgi:predicted DNA-binding protein
MTWCRLAVLNIFQYNLVISEVMQMKSNNKSRFTLDMTPELRTRLKVAAARKGITMRQYSLSAIEDQLEKEEVGALASGTFNQDAVEKAKELQKSIFGNHKLADESTELICQAREERVSQL